MFRGSLDSKSLLFKAILYPDHELESDVEYAESLCWHARNTKEKEFTKFEDAVLAGRDYEEITESEFNQIDSYKAVRDEAWLLSRLCRLEITHILESIATLAETEASKSLLVKRAKNIESARIAHFVNELYVFHMGKFKAPLWDILAMAVSLCLTTERPFTADDIRPLVKTASGGS